MGKSNLNFQPVNLKLKSIGWVHTNEEKIPRHWSVSEIIGDLVIKEEYEKGLEDIHAGQKIVVIFLFHKSTEFTPQFLKQKPPHLDKEKSVFSICSPLRPNPLGMSVLEVLRRKKNIITVKGIDMLNGTPILDIKPDIGVRK